MDDSDTWQTRTLEQLSRHFAAEPDARAFVLTGSLATADVEPDFWSDIDAKIVLADQAIDRYSTSLTWLQPFGQLLGVERHTGLSSKTLCVCLEGFKRFDLVFIPESALQSLTAEDEPLFRQPCTILWSRLPELEKYIASSPASIIYEDTTDATVAELGHRLDRRFDIGNGLVGSRSRHGERGNVKKEGSVLLVNPECK